MPDIRVQIEGLKELTDKMADPAFIAGPLHDFLERSASTVELNAKLRAPGDTGHLKASITHEVKETQAIIEAGVHYAPYVEFGTRPHWPPLAALQPWAQRHGFPPGRAGAFLVARAIAKRGTKAREYMQQGLQDSLSAINSYLRMMAAEIEKDWGR